MVGVTVCSEGQTYKFAVTHVRVHAAAQPHPCSRGTRCSFLSTSGYISVVTGGKRL